MIGGLTLIALSAVLVWAAPRILVRVTASGRRPLLGVLAWQLTAWSVVVGSVFSAVFVTVPSFEERVEVPYLLQACFDMVGGMAQRPHADWMRGVAAVFALLLLGRLMSCAVTASTRTHRRRARHRSLLRLVSRRDDELDALVIAGDVPVVYCVPGPGRFVVFSTAAIERLSSVERRAVLDHEHAHLRGQHHLMLGSVGLLARAFPRVRLFVIAHEHTARLVEMRADDVAARRHGGNAVAAALLSLADVPSDPGVLAATGVGTADRIERLEQPTAWRARDVLPGLAVAAGVLVLSCSPLLLAASTHALLCLV